MIDPVRMATVFVVLMTLTSAAVAAPGLSIEATPLPDRVDWQVFFEPDPEQITAGNGAVSIEFAIEFSESNIDYSTLEIEPTFTEPVDTNLIPNAGENPYVGVETTGVTAHDGAPTEILSPGTPVDALYMSAGSTAFETGGPKLALSFSTLEDGNVDVSWSALVAQAGTDPFAETVEHPEYPVALLVVPGDANRDLSVTGADMNAVLNNFGHVVNGDSGWLFGDANHDGVVTGADLGRVINNFGATVGTITVTDFRPVPDGINGSFAVPEPNAISLLGIACLGFVFARKVSRASTQKASL